VVCVLRCVYNHCAVGLRFTRCALRYVCVLVTFLCLYVATHTRVTLLRLPVGSDLLPLDYTVTVCTVVRTFGLHVVTWCRVTFVLRTVTFTPLCLATHLGWFRLPFSLCFTGFRLRFTTGSCTWLICGCTCSCCVGYTLDAATRFFPYAVYTLPHCVCLYVWITCGFTHGWITFTLCVYARLPRITADCCVVACTPARAPALPPPGCRFADACPPLSPAFTGLPATTGLVWFTPLPRTYCRWLVNGLTHCCWLLPHWFCHPPDYPAFLTCVVTLPQVPAIAQRRTRGYLCAHCLGFMRVACRGYPIWIHYALAALRLVTHL